MKVYYVANIYPQKVYDNFIRFNIIRPEHQIQKHHRLIKEGLQLNGVFVTAIIELPIYVLLKRKKYLNWTHCNNNESFIYIYKLSIPGLGNLCTFLQSFFVSLIVLLRNRDIIVICDNLQLMRSLGAITASKLLKRKVIGYLTDSPIAIFGGSCLKSLLSKIILNSCNAFIFVTKQSDHYLNKQRKPFVVIESQADICMQNIENRHYDKNDKKIVLYAGTIDVANGIDRLLNAFVKVNINDAELHIYGEGELSPQVKEYSKKYDQIKYYGSKPNNDVVEQEMRATLLINPRPTGEVYTYYSFPIKLMEYMASGTAVLTTKLSGIPLDYYDYLYLIEEDSSEGIAQALQKILSLNTQDLHKFGLRAKNWVIKNKNNIKQAEAIIDLIETI